MIRRLQVERDEVKVDRAWETLGVTEAEESVHQFTTVHSHRVASVVVTNPADGNTIGHVATIGCDRVRTAVENAQAVFPAWQVDACRDELP